MVLGPFAETKGPRLPGRHPALPNTKIKPQHMEEKEKCKPEESLRFQTMEKLERQRTG